jgi:hypothetical protein
VLSDLGLWAETRELAARIDATPASTGEARMAAKAAREKADREDRLYQDTAEARAAMREALGKAFAMAGQLGREQEAYDLFLEAHARGAPTGEALVRAGLMASKLGHKAEAQRLFDRGIAEAERWTGKKVTVAPANEIARQPGDEGGKLLRVAHTGQFVLFAADRYVSVYSRSLPDVERLRIEHQSSDRPSRLSVEAEAEATPAGIAG